MTKVPNKNPRKGAKDEYYFVFHVEPTGDGVCLLLTQKEFDRAAARAAKNPEDIPEHSIALQVRNGKIVKKCRRG